MSTTAGFVTSVVRSDKKDAKQSVGKNTISSRNGISKAVLRVRRMAAGCVVLSLVACASGENRYTLPAASAESSPVSESPSDQLSAISSSQAGRSLQANQPGPEQLLRIEPLTQTDPSQANVSVWPSIDSVDTSEIDVTTESEDQLAVNDAYDYAREQLQIDVVSQTPQVPQDQTTSSDANNGYVPPSVNRSNLSSDFSSDINVSAKDTSPGEGFASIAYHRIDHDNSPYTVSPRLFAAHMRYLYDNGYHTLTLAELDDYLSGRIELPLRSVLITVDDGHQSSYSQIHPVLQRYGFNALYFPYSDYINNGGLTKQMMRTMLSDGNAELLSKTAGMRFGFTVNCAANTRGTNPLRLNRCTIGSQDDLDLFATRLLNPRLALRKIASRKDATGRTKVSRTSSLGRIGAPEFLGNLADREFFTGIPIQPFSPYFVDPDGEILVYSASGLPEGLSIDRDSGTISGVPLAATIISGLTISATNQSGTTSRTNAFDLIVH